MDNIDPVTKQYAIFSLIIGSILSFILNFLVVDIFKGTILDGFPLNLGGATGVIAFFYKIIDTLFLAAIFAVPVYMLIMYLLKRQR